MVVGPSSFLSIIVSGRLATQGGVQICPNKSDSEHVFMPKQNDTHGRYVFEDWPCFIG